MGVCGVDYCEEYHLKEYFHKQYGWREDQCDIDKGKILWKRWFEIGTESYALSNGHL